MCMCVRVCVLAQACLFNCIPLYCPVSTESVSLLVFQSLPLALCSFSLLCNQTESTHLLWPSFYGYFCFCSEPSAELLLHSTCTLPTSLFGSGPFRKKEFLLGSEGCHHSSSLGGQSGISLPDVHNTRFP